jgi:glycosyltransferase involved in cell wall biosynthesis
VLGRRVLVLGEFPECNGGENSLMAIVPALQSRGWHFELLGPIGMFAERMKSLGCFHLPIEWHRDGVSQPLDERRRLLAASIEIASPNIVHANSLSMARVAGPVCLELGIPSVGYLRDIVGVSRQVARDVSSHTRLLAVSNATRQFHVRQGVAAEKTVVIYNGIAVTDSNDNIGDNIGDGNSTSQFVIGGVGQIGLRKGWDRLVVAARLVAGQWPEARWVVAGTRHSAKAETVEWEREIRRLSATDTVKDRFQWLGRVHDIDSFYRKLDLLVHPAQQEPLGRALLEAAAHGLPIIATDVGGTREIFPPASHSAIICPADDARSLADAMLRVRDNRDAAAKMGQRAKERIESVFSVSRCAEQVDKVYRQLSVLARRT